MTKRCGLERNTSRQLSIYTTKMSQSLRMHLELFSLEVEFIRYDCSCPNSPVGSTRVYQAINATICHASLIYLYRRVYLLPSDSSLVQSSASAVLNVAGVLKEHNAANNTDIILSLFLADCEGKDPRGAVELLQHLQAMEDAGMSQIVRVRSLLQDRWDSSRDWTELKHNVFLG